MLEKHGRYPGQGRATAIEDYTVYIGFDPVLDDWNDMIRYLGEATARHGRIEE